ncbi:MAG: NAD(P)/FAD-dependent oxidoreductase [Rhodospirillales bacterium]
MKKRIVVLGAGFAGLWSAVGAARKAAELGMEGDVDITVVNRTPYHNIRVRNYESDLSEVCVPLDSVLGPVGVSLRLGDVTAIDAAAGRVTVRPGDGGRTLDLAYDRLVLALGSELVRPPIPGLSAHGFDVDTYDAAIRLDRHIKQLGSRPPAPGRFTAVIVGAGLTGIEVATEMPARLHAARPAGAADEPVKVILADRLPHVGSDMGPNARPVIEDALRQLGIATRLDVTVAAIDASGLVLSSGERIDAATVVWCGGMRASPLTAALPAERDAVGRLLVDAHLRVRGLPDVFAAGDVARVMVEDGHPSMMSCQHGRTMGRYAGHNVAADLLGDVPIPVDFPGYVTCLDLGPQGALFTRGWDRQVAMTGATAKATKRMINCELVPPPRSARAEDILAAAAPVAPRPAAVAGGGARPATDPA